MNPEIIKEMVLECRIISKSKKLGCCDCIHTELCDIFYDSPNTFDLRKKHLGLYEKRR